MCELLKKLNDLKVQKEIVEEILIFEINEYLDKITLKNINILFPNFKLPFYFSYLIIIKNYNKKSKSFYSKLLRKKLVKYILSDDFIDKNDFAIIVNQYKSHLRRIQKQIYDVRYEININNNPTLGFWLKKILSHALSIFLFAKIDFLDKLISTIFNFNIYEFLRFTNYFTAFKMIR